MPIPRLKPEYTELGDARHGLIPMELRPPDRKIDMIPDLLSDVMKHRHEEEVFRMIDEQGYSFFKNIFGPMKTMEGWLLMRVSIGIGFAWRRFYFRLTELYGGSLEYARVPIVSDKKLQWPPIAILRLNRLVDIEENSQRPHAFKITLCDPHEEIFLQANNEDMMLRWMKGVRGGTNKLREQMTAVVMRMRWSNEAGGQELGLAAIQPHLRVLPKPIFDMVTLQHCNFEDNDLLKVPSDIGNLTKLKTLNFRNNRINTLPTSMCRLRQIRVMDLAHNDLSVLPLALGGMTSLQNLDLARNGLATLPDDIGGLTTLTSANLYRNRLTAIPESTACLTSLQILNFHDNRIADCPNEIGALTSLTELSLRRNVLTALPDAFGGLTNLRRLSLEDNRLRWIPDVMGGLTSLTELNLQQNSLTEVPEMCGSLTQLRQLELGYNQLAFLPEALGGLTALTRLGVRENKLALLPSWLSGLTRLEVFDCGYNLMESRWERHTWLTEYAKRRFKAGGGDFVDPWARGLPVRRQLYKAAVPQGEKPVWLMFRHWKKGWQRRLKKMPRTPWAVVLGRGKGGKKKGGKAGGKGGDKGGKKGAKVAAKGSDEEDEDSDDEGEDEDEDEDDEDGEDGGLKKKKKKKNKGGEEEEEKKPTPLDKFKEWNERRQERNRAAAEARALLPKVPLKQRARDTKDKIAYAVKVKKAAYAESIKPEQPVLRYECIPHLLPYELASLTALRVLDLRENRIFSLPRFIGLLGSLQKLDLSFNFLEYLPDSVGKLANLRKLYVRGNRLHTLTNAIGGNIGLKFGGGGEYDDYSDYYSSDDEGGGGGGGGGGQAAKGPGMPAGVPALAMGAFGAAGGDGGYGNNPDGDEDAESEMGFGGDEDEDEDEKSQAPGPPPPRSWTTGTHEEYGGIPDPLEYAGCLRLTHLDLFDNCLQALPETVRHLDKLQVLNCNHNQLQGLPTGTGKLTDLVELRVRDNRLRTLPRQLCNLESGDPNLETWERPGFGLCYLDRSQVCSVGVQRWCAREEFVPEVDYRTVRVAAVQPLEPLAVVCFWRVVCYCGTYICA
jgi:Leucine-rich repeat (LRR) protein